MAIFYNYETMNKGSFYSYSFGCRVNEAEKEEIDRKMGALGYRFDPESPGVYIINTCSVTHKAEREARQMIYNVKKDHPETKIVVTGCAATYWIKNKLYRDLPVDLLIDNVNKEFLVDLIEKRLLDIAKPSRHISLNSNKFLGSGRFMIKIQDGCQRYCTFCIVPYLRGMPKSHRIDHIVELANDLDRKNKISEVVLTAINTQAYGFDTKEKFIDLVAKVIQETEIPRISFGSLHPWSVDEDFFKFYGKSTGTGRLVNFFHIPLQSGSNKILTLMRRGYTREEFVDKLRNIAMINPNTLIATDVIAGFLEENDRDFEETYNFLKDSPISKFHVFRFSKRAKTAAEYMAKRLTEPTSEEKYIRSKALIELGIEKFTKFQRLQSGRTSAALILEKTDESMREVLLDNQLPAYIEAKSGTPGEIKNVKIIEFKKGRLFGRIV